MKRLRLPLSLALACVLVATALPAPATAGAPGKRMIGGINWWRSYAGAGHLYHSRKLSRSARRRARKLMRYDFFAHPPRLRVASFRRVGEVLELHGGHRARVGRTIRRWSSSSPHRRVLLSRGYGRIGVGKATGWYRGHRATIWVVRVGRR